MRKSKIMKALLVFGMSVVAATAMIGFSACNTGTNDNTGDNDSQLVDTDTGNNIQGGNQQGSNTTVDPVEWVVESGASTTYNAGATITDNDLFTLKTSGAGYTTGKTASDGNSQPLSSLSVDGTKITGLQSAIRSVSENNNGEIANGEYADGIYSITAKKTGTVTVYCNFVNNSFNSNRANTLITVTSDADAYFTEKSVNRDGVVAITFVVAEGNTYNIGVINTCGNTGRLWLFGIRAEERSSSTVINYKYGDKLIGNALLSKSGTLSEPADPIRKDARFLGWYDSATGDDLFFFDTIDASKTSIDVYACFIEFDVTINYYKADKTTLVRSVKAFSGYKAEIPADPAGSNGATFLGWYKVSDDTEFNFNTYLEAGTINLYPKFEAAPEGSVTMDWDIVAQGAVASDSTHTATFKSGETTLATVVVNINNGSLKTIGAKVGDHTIAKGIQSGAGDDAAVAEITLAEGYTYTITFYLGSTKERIVMLKSVTVTDDLVEEKQVGKFTTTAASNSEVKPCTWSELSAGNYKLYQSSNVTVSYIVITATPVPADS